jgi:hypothetical protein
MSGQFDQDPTRGRVRHVHDRRTETHYPRPLEIGVAAGGVIFCFTVLGVSLFAGYSLKFADLANHMVRLAGG